MSFDLKSSQAGEKAAKPGKVIVPRSSVRCGLRAAGKTSKKRKDAMSAKKGDTVALLVAGRDRHGAEALLRDLLLEHAQGVEDRLGPRAVGSSCVTLCPERSARARRPGVSAGRAESESNHRTDLVVQGSVRTRKHEEFRKASFQATTGGKGKEELLQCTAPRKPAAHMWRARGGPPGGVVSRLNRDQSTLFSRDSTAQSATHGPRHRRGPGRWFSGACLGAGSFYRELAESLFVLLDDAVHQ